MLDNFGMGEFLILALFALLFFGPERLPQMGARLGRWLSSLTQYSKAFMNQWSEEALVIRDAVAEVKGIRDEIVAAQAEISSSLDTARQDISQTIEEARGTVNEATPSAQKVLRGAQTARPEAAGASRATEVARTAEDAAGTAGGEVAALAKTQQILDDLVRKRSGAQAADQGDTEPEGTGDEDPEWTRNMQAVQEIMSRSSGPKAQPKKETQEAPEVVGTPSAPPAGESLSEAAQEAEPEKEQESAFDRTQRILEDLRKKRSGIGESQPTSVPAEHDPSEQPASVQEAEPGKEQESAFDRTQRILEDLRKKRDKSPEAQPTSAAAQSEQGEGSAQVAMAAGTSLGAEPATDPAQRSTQGKAARDGITYSEFTQLSIQVTVLNREIQALKSELEILRKDIPASKGPAATAQVDHAATMSAEASSTAVSVEEPA